MKWFDILCVNVDMTAIDLICVKTVWWIEKGVNHVKTCDLLWTDLWEAQRWIHIICFDPTHSKSYHIKSCWILSNIICFIVFPCVCFSECIFTFASWNLLFDASFSFLSRSWRSSSWIAPLATRGGYVTIDRQTKRGSKGCPACVGDAKVHPAAGRAGFQDVMDENVVSCESIRHDWKFEDRQRTALRLHQVAAAELLRATPRREMSMCTRSREAPRCNQRVLMSRCPLRSTNVKTQTSGSARECWQEYWHVENAPQKRHLTAPGADAEWRQHIAERDCQYYGAKDHELWDTQKNHHGGFGCDQEQRW